MTNIVAIKITADIVDLATKRAAASAELRAYTKDVNRLADTARSGVGGAELRAAMLQAASGAVAAKAEIAALDRQIKALGATQTVATGITGQQRQGLVVAGEQFRQMSTEVALGIPVQQIFAQQAGQTVQALALLFKEGSAVGTFMTGPWGIAITTAAAVLLPFIGNLLSSKDGAEKAGDATMTLADAEGHLQSIVKADRTGDLAKAANLLADARTRQAEATIMAARAQALLNLEDAKKRQADLADGDIDRAPTVRRARGGGQVVIDNDVKLSDRRARGQGSQLQNARDAAAADIARYQAEIDALDGKVARLADVRLRTSLQTDSSLARSRLALRIATDSLAAAEARRDIIERQAQIRIDVTAAGTKERAQAEDDYVRQVRAADAEVTRIRRRQRDDRADTGSRSRTDRAKAKQLRDAERDERRDAAVSRSLAVGSADTTLSLAKIDFSDRRRDVEALYEAELISAEDKRDRLKQLAQDEADAEVAAAVARKKAYAGDVVAVAAAADQQRLIRAQLDSSLKQIDRDFYDDRERQRRADLERQKQADQVRLEQSRGIRNGLLEIEDQLVSSVLSGRQSLGQALRTVAIQTVQAEIQADLRALSEKRILRAQGLAADQAAAHGGLIAQLVAGGGKRAALAADVAAHVSAEQAKVAASTAGQAGQVSATATGSATKAGIVGASNLKEITSHAATAAAAAYHAMAGIPVVGPVLGAAAAATTFAAVEAYGVLASFDKGANVIPTDMIAQIHAGERIVPAADNRAIIEALNGRGYNKAGEGGRGAPQIHFNPVFHGVKERDVLAELRSQPRELARILKAISRDGRF